MGSISRSFRLLKASFQVLGADKELMVFPLLAFIAQVFAALSFVGISFGLGLAGADMDSAEPGPLHYLIGFAFYFVCYFTTIFFNAAVIGAARIRLDGGDPTVMDGLRAAGANIGKIAAYAAIAATVGLILRTLSERMGLLGKIVIAIIGAAWGAITFFVLPVLVFEPVGPVAAIKRSTQILKERWGEGFIGNGSIGLAMFLLLLPAMALSFAVMVAVHPIAGAVLLVLSIMTVALMGSTLSGIYLSALYAYATTGKVGMSFDENDLNGAFRSKK